MKKLLLLPILCLTFTLVTGVNPNNGSTPEDGTEPKNGPVITPRGGGDFVEQ